jgi:hypothetical protein
MNNLPSFLRPISETVADGATTASSESGQITNFADFLRAEAAKAGLLSDDVKGQVSMQASASAQVKETFADYMGADDEERLRLYTRAFGATLICAGALYYFTK